MEGVLPNNALKEIAHFSGDLGMNNWLYSVGLLQSEDADFTVNVHEDWQRLGAETYTMNFSVESEAQTTSLIAKACIKIPPSSVMSEWVQRRQLLSAHDVPTPHLYAREGAVLIEEFIAHSFEQAYQSSDKNTQDMMRDRLMDLFCTLYVLGFRPNIGLSDLRSHGDDVVIVDFGEDLGGISSCSYNLDDTIGEASRKVEGLLKDLS